MPQAIINPCNYFTNATRYVHLFSNLDIATLVILDLQCEPIHSIVQYQIITILKQQTSHQFLPVDQA